MVVKMKFINYIPKGKTNAITINELQILTGKSKTAIYKQIRKARLNGAVIISTATGLYWQFDENDFDAIKQLKKFITYIQSQYTPPTLRGAKATLKEIQRKGEERNG